MELWKPQHIYHIYPLGALRGEPGGLLEIRDWIPHLRDLEVDTVLLGPIFASESHGYDVTDLRRIDPRLGGWDDARSLVQAFHAAGIRVVLDAVFNHTSRKHQAYRSLQEQGRESSYADWYAQVDWNAPNGWGDSFTVRGWNGYQELPVLNLRNKAVCEEQQSIATLWIQELGIDGMRLDAADVMDREFLAMLSRHCHAMKTDFWMMGEVVHGDYRLWLNEAQLDSVTHYEGYKSLWSSFNDANFFEIAYSVHRLSDMDSGICRSHRLMLFTENHDVPRLASVLKDACHLYPLHLLHYTLPGVPSLYYGGEWGVTGTKQPSHDWDLRPSFGMLALQHRPHPDLESAIRRLVHLRLSNPALCAGGYRQVHVASHQYAFLRIHPEQSLLVAVNSAPREVELSVRVPFTAGRLVDVLNPERPEVLLQRNTAQLVLPANWGSVFLPVP